MGLTYRDRLLAHVRAHFGEPARTIRFDKREPVIELFIFLRPNGKPFNLVVTCGMSSRPMIVPSTVEDPSRTHAELCMLLPPSWPLDGEVMGDNDEWPFEALRSCARLPHEEQTWLWNNHTVFDGEPWPGTHLTSVVLTVPWGLPKDSWVIADASEPAIHLFQLVPITAAELALKKERGTDALISWLFDYDGEVFGALEAARRCSVTDTGPFVDATPVIPPNRPLTDGAWLVIPARRARNLPALDRLLEIAARAHQATELRVRTVQCTDGTYLLLVHGMDMVKLATTLSLMDNRIAALRVYGERAAACLCSNGLEQRARGTREEMLSAVAEHVGTTATELKSAYKATPETRIVRWERAGTPDPDNPNIEWTTAVDADFDIDICTERLATNTALIVDRFGVWRRALDRWERAVAEHDTMKDKDTHAERHEARVEMDDANADVLELLRLLDDSPRPTLFAALARVLDDAGVPSIYMKPFRDAR